jgi:Glutathione S-transferase, N-terminal domain
MQWAAVIAGYDLALGGASLLPRLLRRRQQKRVELRVERLDACQQRVGQLHRRESTPLDQVRRAGDRQPMQFRRRGGQIVRRAFRPHIRNCEIRAICRSRRVALRNRPMMAGHATKCQDTRYTGWRNPLETLMIELYAMGSPDVVKIYIGLEEMGLPYTVHPVDVFGEAQFSSEFLQLNPNAKVPVIVDQKAPGGHGFRIRGHPGLLDRQDRAVPPQRGRRALRRVAMDDGPDDHYRPYVRAIRPFHALCAQRE